MAFSLRQQGRPVLTYLVGHPELSWSSWLADQASNRRVLSLDLGQPMFGPPGCMTASDGERHAAWRFIGSADPTRYPLAVVAGLRDLHPGDQGFTLGFPYRPSPVGRQLMSECLRLAGPDRILAPAELRPSWCFAQSPEWVEGLPAAPTPHAQRAKQRGRWIETLEACETHHLNFDETSIEGVRLGSGQPIANVGDGIDYAEVCGKSLLLATRSALDDHTVAHALDIAHAERAVVVTPEHYIGLACAFAKEDGSDFGIGRLTDIDFVARTLTCRCTAVAPARVKVLKLGAMRIDETGRELPPEKPWAN